MKTIIAGGREYILSPEDFAFLDKLKVSLPITEVVSGCARGADRGGEVWAKKNGIPIQPFPADWDGLGRGAGHIRNAQMAKYAEAAVLFPGGSGTQSMLALAKKHGLWVFDRMISNIPTQVSRHTPKGRFF